MPGATWAWIASAGDITRPAAPVTTTSDIGPPFVMDPVSSSDSTHYDRTNPFIKGNIVHTGYRSQDFCTIDHGQCSGVPVACPGFHVRGLRAIHGTAEWHAGSRSSQVA